ncbi:hypothetical protein SprV_0301146900 [Sparganum proliferum]
MATEGLIVNTTARPMKRKKATWMHPWLRHWHLPDYVLVRRRDQRDVLVTKAIPCVDESTDHCLAIFKMRIRLQPHSRPQCKRPPGDLNIALLPLTAHHPHFNSELAQQLANLLVASAVVDDDVSMENRWRQLRDTVQSTTQAVLSCACRHQQPATDFKKPISTAIQDYADRNEWKNLFASIKAVNGPTTKAVVPLLSADGSTLLTVKTQILQRWAKHFRGVLNRPSTISDATIAHLPQVEANADLVFPPLSGPCSNSQAESTGLDAFPAEIYKHGGYQLIDHLRAFIQEYYLMISRTPQSSISTSRK